MSKVVRLSASNILRLTAVEIVPTDDMIIIGGENGAGKSSVLNAIAMALGGSKLVPEMPIHGDESEGSVTVDLGEFVVTRKFKRERETMYGDKLDEKGNVVPIGQRWSDVKSSLVIKNKEGASYPSPQAMLDKLVSKLSFDPLEFSQMSEDAQYSILRSLVKLDTSALDQRRASIYDERTIHNRNEKNLVAQINASTFHTGVPEEEVSLGTISDRMLAAEKARQAADQIERQLNIVKDTQSRLDHEVTDAIAQMELLKRKIEEQQKLIDRKVEEFKDQDATIPVLTSQLLEARAAVPDVESIRQELTTVEATNQKVRANKQFMQLDKQLASTREQVKRINAELEKIEGEKADRLAALQFPIPGLGFGDGKVFYSGLPLKQASTAQQLKVSVAIGIAVHPELKVLLIRRGSDLDSKSLKAVAEQAAASGTQIWLEKVTESKEGVTVMIEDGHVA